jgi:hypothetical protein
VPTKCCFLLREKMLLIDSPSLKHPASPPISESGAFRLVLFVSPSAPLNPDRPAQAVAFEPRFDGVQKETVNLGILIERIPLESLQSSGIEVKHDRRGCFLERRMAPMPCRRWGIGFSY